MGGVGDSDYAKTSESERKTKRKSGLVKYREKSTGMMKRRRIYRREKMEENQLAHWRN